MTGEQRLNSKKARGDSVPLIEQEEENNVDEAVIVEDELIKSDIDFGSLKSRLSQTLQAIKSWKKSFPKTIDPTPTLLTERLTWLGHRIFKLKTQPNSESSGESSGDYTDKFEIIMTDTLHWAVEEHTETALFNRKTKNSVDA